MNKLKVGAAKVCINPRPDMYPIPTTNRDFGLTEPHVQQEPHDDMFCRAIVVDNGKKRLLLVSYELSTTPTIENIENRLAEAAGTDLADVFITATHSHSGPHLKNRTPEEKAFASEYYSILLNAGIEAAKKAASSMREARYGYGETLSFTNVNRDYQSFGGDWLEGRNPEGYSDKTVALIKFVDTEGKVIASLVNYAMHNTCVYMMKDFDHKAKTSGNVSGVACRFVEDYYGNGSVALWTSGCAGDQNPLLSHGLQYEYPDGFVATLSYPDGVGFMQMEAMGRRHGADIVKGLEAINEYRDILPVGISEKKVELPTQKFKNGRPESWSLLRPGSMGPRPEGEVYRKYVGPEMVANPEEPAVLDMRFVKFGDIAIIFMNAEVYSLLGKKIKDASPYKKTFIVCHSGTADGRVEYIQDEEDAHHTVLQHYSRVIPGSSDKLVLQCEADVINAELDEEIEA